MLKFLKDELYCFSLKDKTALIFLQNLLFCNSKGALSLDVLTTGIIVKRTMSNPKIAVIGLEASGKTVLMSVLAKKLSQTVHQGYFLDPKGVASIKYVEGVWQTLQNLDWPASTPPGEMFNLQWKLRVSPEFSGDGKTYEAELHLLDAAGQDMRQLFAFDAIEDIPQYLRPLAEYCIQADILLIALNIKDFVGKSVDSMRRIENQATIKAALDMLEKSNQHVAILFTQMDQYKPYIEKIGGLENFCRLKLPYIYNAYVVNSSNSLISVAAVNETVVVQKEDGKLVRVPKPNFSSLGLDDVCKWLSKQVIEVSNRKSEKENDENKTLNQSAEAQNNQSVSSFPTKKCPFCSETIPFNSSICQYCGSELESLPPPLPSAVVHFANPGQCVPVPPPAPNATGSVPVPPPVTNSTTPVPVPPPVTNSTIPVPVPPPMPAPSESESDNDSETVYTGDAAYQYVITEFIKQNPIERKWLSFYPNITDEILGYCGFPLEDGEVPLIAIGPKPWFGIKKCWTSLLITNRHVHYRAVNYYGFRDIFYKRKTESLRWDDISKLDFDYAYYNYKGGYMGSPFYINGDLKGMIYIVELNWLLILPIPCVDDAVIDWFQGLFECLAETELIQYAPGEAEYPNAGGVFRGWLGRILSRF